MESENNTPLEHQPIEHQNVPTAHKGLHDLLYSSDSEHSVGENSTNLDFDGTFIVSVSEWQNQTENIKVAGVYAVLDGESIYQYVGYSRDVLRSLKGHISQHGDQVCSFIRVKTFKVPKRFAMEDLRDEWLGELDYTPAGNVGGSGKWASTIGEAAKATMTETEKNAYEEKKFKLRKAMADGTLTTELLAKEPMDETEIERRQKLEAAVKNDDWSSVIEP